VRHDLNGFTGDPGFIQNDYAKKIFSKLRSSIGGLYYWRLGPAAPPEYRAKSGTEYQATLKEADFAFRQGFALCPYSPEAVFRYVQLLLQLARVDDALLVAGTCLKLDPENSQVRGLVQSIKGYKAQSAGMKQAQAGFQQMEHEVRNNPTNSQAASKLAGTGPLSVYANLAGKTVLMPSALPVLADSISSDLPPDKTQAITRIESALSEKGLEVVQDGPHFVRVFPGGARGSLASAPLRGAELAASKGQATIPMGMINFSGADLGQVLSIYGVMSQRTILRSGDLPRLVVRLKTECALTHEEAVYAIATVLALNGVSMVDDGTKFVQIVPTAQRAQVKTRAPKPQPSAKLFDPDKAPSVGVSDSLATERTERESQRLQKALSDFMYLPERDRSSARRLLELYACFAGKTAVPSTNFDRMPIGFYVQAPLTSSELLYGIETTVALNNLAIIHVDEHRIRLSR
jgi:hypothetical protein